MPTCAEVVEAFEEIAPLSLGTEDDRRGGAIGLRWGDPATQIRGVAVTWCVEMAVLEQAAAKGLNLIIAHEPLILYETNLTTWYTRARLECHPSNLKRMKLLLNNDMCVVVAHSNWDMKPELGMGDTLKRLYGFTDEISRDGVVAVYRTEPTTLAGLARMVKDKLGLESVRVAGDLEMQVERVGLGWGRMARIVDSLVLQGAHAGVVGELRAFDPVEARDAGIGLIEGTHLATEAIAMRNVVPALKGLLPNLPIEFIENERGYRLVS